MPITSLDGIVVGARPPEDILKVGGSMEASGIHHSLAYTAGRPGAAVAPTPGIAGAALTTYAGQVPFVNPVSPAESKLCRWSGRATLLGALLLYDRLWHNSGIAVTTTTAQTVNSVAWPARDRDGSTNGENVLVAIEVSTATTNASAITNTTMSYTNQAGTTGRTATIPSFPATAVAGTFVPFLLAAGDTGIRSIQSITLGTSYGGGTIHLVAYRLLAKGHVNGTLTGFDLAALQLGFPRLYDNTVPFCLWLASGTGAVTVGADFVVTQG